MSAWKIIFPLFIVAILGTFHHVEGTLRDVLFQSRVNIALQKPAYQQYPYIRGNTTFDASYAVDGRKSNMALDGGQCAVSAEKKETATWWVNLTRIHSIHHITIYFMTNNTGWSLFAYFPQFFLGFPLYVSNTTDDYQIHGKLCFKDNNFTLSTIPPVVNISCPSHGQYVIYYNERLESGSYPSEYSFYAVNNLCEVEVYGCNEEGFYGENCSAPCPDVNCQYCHIETGTCQGCKPGYQGNMCISACEEHFFGINCSQKCDKSCVNKACLHETGECQSPDKNFSLVGGSIAAIAITFLVGIVIYRARNKTCKQGKTRSMEDETSVTINLYNLSNTLPLGLPDICQNIEENEIKKTSMKMSENPCKVSEKVSKSKEFEDDNDDETNEEGNSHGDLHINGERLIPDIAVNNLGKIIQEYSANDDDGFKKEYETLFYEEIYPCDIAKLPANIPKNRFKTVLPYDHSRVILVNKDSDYINANYIDVFGQEKVYIATQGPRQNTVETFWLMVWQENVSQIVMLTNVTEGKKAKCVQYWPDLEEDFNCDVFTISITHQRQYANYVIRKMKIWHRKRNESRISTQFQYTSWPDHGVPDPLNLLLFKNHVTRSICVTHGGPTLVHCSAGIGRTGTYIAIDALLREGQRNSKINIAECVKEIRENRMNMVQTYEQYKTIYQTLHLMFISPPTVQSETEFLQKLHTENTENPTSGLSLRDEFEKLQSIRPRYTEEDYTIATQYGELSPIHPLDNYIIYLTTSVPKRGNYINAITLPSFTNRDAFIITQCPTPENAIDFQRLIIESESEVVVCMEPLTNAEYEDIWIPTTNNSRTAYPFIVQLKQEEHMAETTCRKVEITNERIGNKTYSIEWAEPLFHLTQVNSQTVSQILSLVFFARNVESERPIIIISRDGAALCGVYCAVYNLIQQLTMDEEIDVFSVVRLLQTRRPELCDSLDEYKMIHDALFRFIKSRTNEHNYCNQQI